ncbi:MAG: hypothetical protein GY937_12890 [bacterium]|nr:hypothetical protein [bacterium]
MPDSEVRVPVDAGVAERFSVVVRLLAGGDAAGAARASAGVGYEVVEIRDGSSRYWLLSEVDDQGVGPLVVISASPERDLIAEAPHPTFEVGTGAQAIELVAVARARAAIMAGAHRCASSNPSGCDGKTSVCNQPIGPPSRPYPDSDVAHSPSSLFHAAHQTLTDVWPDAIVAQLHGMGRGRAVPKGQKTRPPQEWTWFIVSGGEDSSASGSPLSVRVRDALRASAGGGDVRAVSCQDPRDKRRFQHRNLCGTKNVQSRELFGQRNACTSGTSAMSPRFLHVEQRFDPVLNDALARKLVVESLMDAIPQSASGTLLR